MGFIPSEVISGEKNPLRHCEKIEFQVIQMIVSKELLLKYRAVACTSLPKVAVSTVKV
jgi:hypothetical protein